MSAEGALRSRRLSPRTAPLGDPLVQAVGPLRQFGKAHTLGRGHREGQFCLEPRLRQGLHLGQTHLPLLLKDPDRLVGLLAVEQPEVGTAPLPADHVPHDPVGQSPRFGQFVGALPALVGPLAEVEHGERFPGAALRRAGVAAEQQLDQGAALLGIGVLGDLRRGVSRMRHSSARSMGLSR